MLAGCQGLSYVAGESGCTMILTCPQCATRYQIDDSKFPPEGRKVRCTKCGQTWFQAALPPEPEPGRVSAPATAGIASLPLAGQAGIEPPPGPMRPAAPAETRRRHSAPGERMAAVAGWIGLLAVLGLIVWGGIRYRDAIADVWPQTSRLYAALGLPANVRGPAFESVSYRRDIQAGQPVLIVNGTIVNAGAREIAVPSIQVVLTDNRRRSVDRWVFSPPQPRLKPGARMAFTTRRANPPPAARHLDIHFAGAAG
jgi:predicted Zn finger-like uncharacterized protein